MRFLIGILLSFVVLQTSLATPNTYNWRRCVEVVLAGVAESASHVAGIAEWTLDALDTVENLEKALEVCDGLARNDPPSTIDNIRVSACRTKEVSLFVEEVTRLTNDLMALGDDTVQIAQDFLRDIKRCNRRWF